MRDEENCLGCEVRCVGCHGKNQDGTWRCRSWGMRQDKLTEERRRTAREWKGEQVFREYGLDSKRRHEIRKHSGHIGR